jgi:RNA polymerase sigma-70 factor (ECF subfamily)
MNAPARQGQIMQPYEVPPVDEERAARIAALFMRRSTLSKSEAALLREVFPLIFDEHFELVMSHLRRRGVREDVIEDNVQEVFIALFVQILEDGFPQNIPAMLHTIAEGRARNHHRTEQRAPTFVPIPSSRTEKPRSVRDIERIIDVQSLLCTILPEIPADRRRVVELVLLQDLTCEEAAELLKIPDGTVKTRLLAARKTIKARMEEMWPESQR